MPRDTAAVILAAGTGRRMGGRNKALLELAGEPLLLHSLRTIRGRPAVAQVVLVISRDDSAELERVSARSLADLGADRVVPGGEERWLSSRAGCAAADADFRIVLVHDAARPLVDPAVVDAVIAAAREQGAALAAEPLHDTLKQAGADGRVVRTLPREGLWRAQTPQAFHRGLLQRGFAAWPAGSTGIPTDEAAVVEALGHAPVLVPSPSTNLKVTTQPDLDHAEALLRRRAAEELR